MDEDPARRHYRLLLRTRGGSNGATMYDVQLQVTVTRQLVWAHTFSDHAAASRLSRDVERDLAALDVASFRRRYGVPPSG